MTSDLTPLNIVIAPLFDNLMAVETAQGRYKLNKVLYPFFINGRYPVTLGFNIGTPPSENFHSPSKMKLLS